MWFGVWRPENRRDPREGKLKDVPELRRQRSYATRVKPVLENGKQSRLASTHGYPTRYLTFGCGTSPLPLPMGNMRLSWVVFDRVDLDTERTKFNRHTCGNRAWELVEWANRHCAGNRWVTTSPWIIGQVKRWRLVAVIVLLDISGGIHF